MKKYAKTKKGLVTRIYCHQRHKSKLRDHRPPEYSLQELMDWVFSDIKFHTMFNEWVISEYSKDLTPSIDRKNDDIHYCFSNIQLLTWFKNNQKAYSDRKLFRTNKRSAKVKQLALDGDMVATYHSISAAARATGICRSNISSCCGSRINNHNTAGEFMWEYK